MESGVENSVFGWKLKLKNVSRPKDLRRRTRGED